MVQKYCFPTPPLKFCQQLFRDTFYIYLIMHYIKYISPPIIGFKWDWSVAKCTEHYVASCTSFSFEQELHYSGGWRVPSPFQWSFHCQIFEQLPTKKTLITLISVPFSDLRISVAITLSTILPLPNLCQFHQLLRKRSPAHWGGGGAPLLSLFQWSYLYRISFTSFSRKELHCIGGTHVAQWFRWRCLASNWEQDAPS